MKKAPALPSAVYLPDDPYMLVSVAKASAPFGPDGRDWHRYVIAQGSNQIVGHRPGTPEEARRAIEEIVVQLNSRRFVRPGRVNLSLGNDRKGQEQP